MTTRQSTPTRPEAFTPSADQLRDMVAGALEGGRIAETYEPLRQLVQAAPDDVSIRLLFGVICSETGRVDQAETAFTEVVRRDPESTAALHNLAILYFGTNRPALAEEKLWAILKIHPDDPETLNDLAVLYQSTERHAEAEKTYDTMVTLAPAYRKGWQNALEFAYNTARYAGGKRWSENLAARDPANAELAAWQDKFTKAGETRSASSADGPELTATPKNVGTVAVVVPVYNGEDWIVETVESLLKQDYPDCELVIVDDGSVDDTPDVLDPYQNKITLLSRKHEGWASAANAGIQHVRSPWIMAIAGGGRVSPETVSGLVSRAAGAANSAAATDDDDCLIFRRDRVVSDGFFACCDDDERGVRARRLMHGALDLPAADTSVDDEYDRQIITCRRRVVNAAITAPVPAVHTEKRTGKSILFVGADDPMGMFSSFAAAINAYTPHRCRVAVHQTTGSFDSCVILRREDDQRANVLIEKEVSHLAGQADHFVFIAGVASGAARHDRRLEDTSELPFGQIDWTKIIDGRPCAAFLVSSPSVRGNYRWYGKRFTERGWPILSSVPDICLQIPEAHFVPPVLNPQFADLPRADRTTSPVGVVYNGRPTYAGAGDEIFLSVIELLKEKHGRRVLFGQCTNLSLEEALTLRCHAQVGIDRISVGAPRFGLTSLENSAMGLANIVYLDAFARSLLRQALHTDELPWWLPESAEALYDCLDMLIGDPKTRKKNMNRTAAWYRQYWDTARLVENFVELLNQ